MIGREVNDIFAAHGFQPGPVVRWREKLVFDRSHGDVVWRVALQRQRFLSGSLHAGIIVPIVFQLMNEWLIPLEHSLGSPCIYVSRLRFEDDQVVAVLPDKRQGRGRDEAIGTGFLDEYIMPFFDANSSIIELINASRRVAVPRGAIDWQAMRRACLQVGLGDTDAAVETLREAERRGNHWEYDKLRLAIARHVNRQTGGAGA